MPEFQRLVRGWIIYTSALSVRMRIIIDGKLLTKDEALFKAVKKKNSYNLSFSTWIGDRFVMMINVTNRVNRLHGEVITLRRIRVTKKATCICIQTIKTSSKGKSLTDFIMELTDSRIMKVVTKAPQVSLSHTLYKSSLFFISLSPV